MSTLSLSQKATVVKFANTICVYSDDQYDQVAMSDAEDCLIAASWDYQLAIKLFDLYCNTNF